MTRFATFTGAVAVVVLVSACSSTERPLGEIAQSPNDDSGSSTSTSGNAATGNGGGSFAGSGGQSSTGSAGSSMGGAANGGSAGTGTAGTSSTTTDGSISTNDSSTPPGDASTSVPLWVRQFGGPNDDDVRDVTVDVDGNIYTVGAVGGMVLGGQAIAGGSYDAFVRKFAPTGEMLWSRQFGSTDSDAAESVSTDRSGNVYVAGFAGAALPGQTALGAWDAFVRKYDASGNELWTHQFGSSGYDSAWVAVDAAGNAYVSGATAFGIDQDAGSDAAVGGIPYVRKYDGSGNEVWTRQFENIPQNIAGLATVDDTGNVYFAGYVDGALTGQTGAGGEDGFVRKYDNAGNVLWTRQFGTSSNEGCTSVRADASAVYVVGRTFGAFPNQTNAGGADAFVRKYDVLGNEQWTRQFGTSAPDLASAVQIGASGVIYVGGSTSGTLPGQTSAGSSDIFLQKYDAGGSLVETRQIGTSEIEQGISLALSATALYVGGETNGAFAPNEGMFDGFLAKLLR
jgi:hypothetical protein